jgi:hypothetical protein
MRSPAQRKRQPAIAIGRMQRMGGQQLGKIGCIANRLLATVRIACVQAGPSDTQDVRKVLLPSGLRFSQQR